MEAIARFTATLITQRNFTLVPCMGARWQRTEAVERYMDAADWMQSRCYVKIIYKQLSNMMVCYSAKGLKIGSYR